MIEISTPTLAVNQTTTHTFYYRNATSQIQIIQVEQAIPKRLEKVIFPGERILFYAIPEASFAIYTSTTTGLALVEQVPCSQLQVIEKEV